MASELNKGLKRRRWFFLGSLARVCLAVLVTLLFPLTANRVSSALAIAPPLEETAPVIPPDGQAYFGFTYRYWDSSDPREGDTRVFSSRYSDAIAEELAGKSPSLFGVPVIWQDSSGNMIPFSDALGITNQFLAVRPNGVPLISWNAQTGWDAASPTYSGITTKTINSGTLDAYVRQYALDVKAYGQPVFIRLICGEANGLWWHNCSPGANASLTKGDFISAWRRVVDIFRQESVTNVSWVWNMNSFPPPPSNWGVDTNIASYYPGDDYVSWVGVDHYDYGNPGSSTETPLNVGPWLDPHYSFAVTHDKPFFLAEWGIRHSSSVLSAQQQASWLAKMFDYVSSHPRIKASLYFNYQASPFASTSGHIFLYGNQVNYAPDVNDADHRLLAESGANFRSTFTNRIGDARYISYDSTLNEAPTISDVSNQSTAVNTPTGVIPFTVGDEETAAGNLIVTAASSNLTLLPVANIVLGSGGAARTVTLTPAPNQSGTATVTLTVSDGARTASDTFVLTVTAPVNTAPTISDVANQGIAINTTTGPLAFTVGDGQTAAGSLTVTRASSNLTLVPTANIVLGGSGAARSVTVTPATNQSGSATITLTVSDGTLTASDTFVVTVTAPPVNTTTLFPGGATIVTGTLSAGTAASLVSDNNAYFAVNSSTSGTRTTSWYGEFTGVSASLMNLRVTYKGNNSASCTQTVAIWRWTDSTWVQLDSRSVNTTEVALNNLVPSGAPANYVSSSGEVRVRVQCTRTGNFTARGDLLSIAYDVPAGPPPPDTTAPARTNGAPSGVLVAGTTQTMLSVTTNEAAICKYGPIAGTAYAGIPNTFTTTGNTTHSAQVASLTNGSSYAYYVRCQDASANLNTNTDDYVITFAVAMPTAPPTAGLVAAFNFEEAGGATVTDFSGNGNTGTITAATRTTGKYGTGLSFNGTTAYVRVPDAASLDLATTGTIAAWVYQSAASDHGGIVHKGQASDFSDEAYSFQFNGTSRRPELWLTSASTSKVATATTAGALSLVTWHYVAVTWDSSGVKIYINGVLNTSATGAFTPRNSTGALFLGSQAPGLNAFAGTLDDVRIYNRSLSLAEVQAAMNTPVAP